LGKPDPVVEALRNLEKDVMGRLDAVSYAISQAQATAKLGTITTILNKAEEPLKDFVDFWNRIYPQGSVNGTLNPVTAKKFKEFAGGNIGNYRDQWNILVQCLAGQNVDCVLGQKTVLEILLTDGENYDRPLRLTQAIQYYFLLLQKSSVAICAYSRLFLDDDDSCKLLPGLKDGLTSVTTSMQRAIMKMKTGFSGSFGSGKLPLVISSFVDQHADKGVDGVDPILNGVRQQLDTYYFADGLASSFGFGDAYGITVSHGSGNWKSAAWASGGRFGYKGYDIHYMFTRGSGSAYSSSDCRNHEGSLTFDKNTEYMADCLHSMHGAQDWVFRTGRRRFNVFAGFRSRGGCYQQYGDVDVRLIVPGSCTGANGLVSRTFNSSSDDFVLV